MEEYNLVLISEKKDISININSLESFNVLNNVITYNSLNDAKSYLQNNLIHFIVIDSENISLNNLDFLNDIFIKPEIIFINEINQNISLSKSKLFHIINKNIDYELLELIQYLIDNKINRKFGEAEIIFRDQKLYINTSQKKVSTNIDNILFIEGNTKHIKIYLNTKDFPYILKFNINRLEEILYDSEFFIRVHKSYIVNIYRVDFIRKNKIVYDKMSIPISTKKKSMFNDLVRNSFLN